MSDLVRWNDEPVNWQTRRELQRIRREAQLKRAGLEARTQEALAQVTAKNKVELADAHQRLDGGFDLADHTVARATGLNHRINHASAGNPELELTLREVEYKVGLGASLIAYDYLTRRQ